MKCYDCGSSTKVLTTRTADSAPSSAPALIKEGDELVGWYTPDWAIRIRRCDFCNKSWKSIEIPVEDLQKGWQPRES